MLLIFISYIYSDILSGVWVSPTCCQGCGVPTNRMFYARFTIESFFDDQRSRGHWNTNPTVQQYSIQTFYVSVVVYLR